MNSARDSNSYSGLAKWIVFVVALAYVIPYLLLGHNCYLRLHDTLEGEWEWLKILADSHTAFNFHNGVIVPQVMKGLPRAVYPTGLSVNMLLVQTFGAYYAYIISTLLIRIIGFTGVTLLLSRYFIQQPERRFIVWLLALIFSVLSVFTPFGLSVMGQPLLLWAFLNLNFRRQLIISYFIILLFPFYASIVWLFVPFIALLVFAGVYLYLRSKVNIHYVAGMFLLSVVFALINFPILSAAFTKTDFVQHRLSYNLYMFGKPDIVQSFADALLKFFITHYHIATFIPAAVMIAIALVIKKSERLLLTILITIIAICLFEGLYPFIEYSLGNKITLIKTFRFNRFVVLLPFLWITAFALALNKMSDIAIFKPLILPLVFAQLFIALAGNDELLHNYRMLTGFQEFPAFENYTAPRQFDKIKKYINAPQNSYYVASLGISPSVAQYNGFYTLDGLMSVYDLKYKQTFRNLFSKEIDKSNEIAQYYDGWGNRCYIFSSELGTRHQAFNCYKFSNRSIEHFDFNAQAFAAMGGKYLISAVEIKNHDQIGLHLEKTFSDDQSWWTIYLYSLTPAP